jgi:SP family myo-inositol transporter-like MFS transporter 13
MTSTKTANIDLATPQNEKNEKRDSIDDTSDILADVYHDTETGEISEAAVIAEGEERTTWFIWLLVSATAISGLLFGEHRKISHDLDLVN